MTIIIFGQFLSLLKNCPGEEKKMKTCKDVMTPNPVCCLPTDNVIEVAQTMKRENIGPMPVIDNTESQKLIGIITDRDLAMKIVGEGRDPRSTRVEAVMSRKVVTCRADDEINIAMKLMSDHQIRRIVIVDNVNTIKGIISQADLATRMNQPEKTAEVVKEISQANND